MFCCWLLFYCVVLGSLRLHCFLDRCCGLVLCAFVLLANVCLDLCWYLVLSKGIVLVTDFFVNCYRLEGFLDCGLRCCRVKLWSCVVLLFVCLIDLRVVTGFGVIAFACLFICCMLPVLLFIVFEG